MKKISWIFRYFNFSLVLKISNVLSWPTYPPTMSLFCPKLPYLPTQKWDVINGRSPMWHNSHATVLSSHEIPIFPIIRNFHSLTRISVHCNIQKPFICTSIVQVNNYEIVVKFFHISHNLTWCSAIVHTEFTRIHPVCSTYELTKESM